MEAMVKILEDWTSLEFRQGIEKGREEGIEKAQRRHARKLLAMGMCIEDVCDVTELKPEQVERLRNDAQLSSKF